MVYLRMAVVTLVISGLLDPVAGTAQLFVKYLFNCYNLADQENPAQILPLQYFRLYTETVWMLLHSQVSCP